MIKEIPIWSVVETKVGVERNETGGVRRFSGILIDGCYLSLEIAKRMAVGRLAGDVRRRGQRASRGSQGQNASQPER
ncbi:MAG: hypothetical protein H0W10_08025 [Chloroflexi bacterium]|nr:hypothetical protein [Chloroflexota bacterium]